MTAVAAPAAAGSAPAVRGTAQRGTTTLADQVVEKIAGQAASEIGSAQGRSGGFLGIGTEADSSARPKVDVTLYDDFADIDITLGIAYPGSLRQSAQRVRDRVSRRVQDLTGVLVHRVDITISFLDVVDPDGPGQLR